MGDNHELEKGINELAGNIVAVNIHPNGFATVDEHIAAPCVEIRFNHRLEWGTELMVIRYKDSKYAPRKGQFYNGNWGNDDLENLIYQALGQYINAVMEGLYDNATTLQ